MDNEIRPDVLVVAHTVRCDGNERPSFAAAANEERELDKPFFHSNICCRREEGARRDADADGGVQRPCESESKRKDANEVDLALGQRRKASCSKTMVCKDGVDFANVEMAGAERETLHAWPTNPSDQARKRRRDQDAISEGDGKEDSDVQTRTHVDKCYDCKMGQFARRKNSPKQCRSMPGGRVKGAMGHTACDWQDDARTKARRLEEASVSPGSSAAPEVGRMSCFRCKKVICSPACRGVAGPWRKYLGIDGHGNESEYTVCKRQNDARKDMLHSTANKGTSQCRQHQVPTGHEPDHDKVTGKRSFGVATGVQACTLADQSLDKCYECKFGQFARRKNSPKQCRSMVHSGVKGAMGHTTCNWQDDARSKAHHMGRATRASIYFEEDDGGVCGDEPKLMMPGASAEMRVVGAVSEPLRRRRLANWVPRLRHGPAALVATQVPGATPLSSAPPEAEDGSPDAGQNAVRHHAVKSDDGRGTNLLGNAGLLNPVVKTSTLVRPLLLATLDEAQETDCEHQSWRRRCGDCKCLMSCYFGMDECRCRER